MLLPELNASSLDRWVIRRLNNTTFCTGEIENATSIILLYNLIDVPYNVIGRRNKSICPSPTQTLVFETKRDNNSTDIEKEIPHGDRLSDEFGDVIFSRVSKTPHESVTFRLNASKRLLTFIIAKNFSSEFAKILLLKAFGKLRDWVFTKRAYLYLVLLPV